METLIKVLLIGTLIYGILGIGILKVVKQLDTSLKAEQKRIEQVLTIKY